MRQWRRQRGGRCSIRGLAMVAVLTGSVVMAGLVTPARADGLPTLSIGDASIVEGDSGSSTLVFSVTLSAPAATDVTFRAATNSGSADSDDYQPKGTTTRIRAGKTEAAFSVKVFGDTLIEGTHTFPVKLSQIVGADPGRTNGTGAIIDNDPPTPGAQLSVGDASVLESDTGTRLLRFAVTLDEPSATDVSVRATAGAGTAVVPDYVARSARLTIKAGKTGATFNVKVNGDTVIEADETLVVTLTDPIGTTIHRAVGTGTILTEDVLGTPAITDSDPSGTKPTNIFKILGTAAEDNVQIFWSSSCGGSPVGTGTAATFSTGITINAPLTTGQTGTFPVSAKVFDGTNSSGCSAPFNVSVAIPTCNDGNAYTTDSWNGGTGSCTNTPTPRDLDLDGFTALQAVGGSPDCNDQNVFVNPLRPEVPNGIDDNCDGITV